MPIESYTRSVDDVITAVKRQFGDESGVQITNSDIFRWVDDAQREIVVKNSELNAVYVEIAVTAGTADYPLLSEIPDILKLHSVHYNGSFLPSMSFLAAQEYIINNSTTTVDYSDTPQLWYEYGGVMHIWPTPQEDLATGLKIFYSRKPDLITTTGDGLDVPDSYFKTIVDFCLQQAYEMDENQQMAQLKEDQFNRSVEAQGNDTQSQMRSYPTIQALPEDWA